MELTIRIIRTFEISIGPISCLHNCILINDFSFVVKLLKMKNASSLLNAKTS